MTQPPTPERIAAARAAVQRDPSASYDAMAPAIVDGYPAEHVHLALQALDWRRVRGAGGAERSDTRELLVAEPRWGTLLLDIARDAGVHADFRVRALALLSRTGANEPRERVLDFAAHTDLEDLAEIVLAYDDPSLVEALLAKAPRKHRADLEMFLGIPKKQSPARSATGRKPGR